jgi:hypothetical protein
MYPLQFIGQFLRTVTLIIGRVHREKKRVATDFGIEPIKGSGFRVQPRWF